MVSSQSIIGKNLKIGEFVVIEDGVRIIDNIIIKKFMVEQFFIDAGLKIRRKLKNRYIYFYALEVCNDDIPKTFEYNHVRRIK